MSDDDKEKAAKLIKETAEAELEAAKTDPRVQADNPAFMLSIRIAADCGTIASLMHAVGAPTDRDFFVALITSAAIGLQRHAVTASQIGWIAEQAAIASKSIADFGARYANGPAGEVPLPTKEELMAFSKANLDLAEKILAAFGDGKTKVGNA